MICYVYCKECSSYHELELGIDKCPDCGAYGLIMLNLQEEK